MPCCPTVRQTQWHPKQSRGIRRIRIRNKRSQRFDYTYQDSTQHGSDKVTNTAENRGRQGKYTKLKSNSKNRAVVLYTVAKTSRTCKCHSNQECDSNATINIDTHKYSR